MSKTDPRLTNDLRALELENANLRATLAARDAERTLLFQERAALRTVISSIPYFVFWKDRSSTFLGCNDSFAKLGGLVRPEDIVGKTDYDLPWKKEESDSFREHDQQLMQSGVPLVDCEESLLDADGREKVILTSKVLLRGEDGNVSGLLGIFTDITARKQMERALESAKLAAEAANQAKSDFLATVSHELRTPLALILGPLGTLCARDDFGEDTKRELERVHRSAWRLKSLVDDFLDFAKAEAGKAEAREEVVELSELVRVLAEDTRSAAISRRIELHVDSGNVGWVLVDRRMCEKIVLNLLSNALKFTPAGGEVRLRMSTSAEHIELEVVDTGPGIAPVHHVRLFQRFSQIDSSSTRRHDGTGLGLALVKQFSELMGGSAGVESDVGKGSRFWVRLPLRPTDEAPDETPAGSRTMVQLRCEAGAASSIRSDPMVEDATRPRLLLAEDNAELRAYVTSLLRNDYSVVACANGALALAEAERVKPHVIVSDIMMPEMDGYELLARIKADPALSDVPVVLLTAQTGREAVVDSLARGADDFLMKPFSPSELVARVGVAARLRTAHDALVERNRELLQTRDRLVEAEKFSALGRLLSQLSHEINNPMSAILGNIPPLLDYLAALREMLEQYRHTDDAELRALREKLEIDFILGDFATGLHSIDEAAARVRDIQQDLRSFLRGDEVEQTPADLNEAIRSIVEMLKRGLPGSIAINASFGELPDVCFNSGQMKQVCINLLRNAVDALGSAGTIDLATRATATSVLIQISDSGPGVPAAIRGRIFEPYFTTKDIVSGSGLGLAVCRRIVEDHAGSIRLDETYTNGCRFVIELPMSGGTGGDGRKEAPARAARG